MLLPYWWCENLKHKSFTPILALCTCLYRSHLQKYALNMHYCIVYGKYGKKFSCQWLWHSLTKLCTKNYENPSIFVKVTAKKLVTPFFWTRCTMRVRSEAKMKTRNSGGTRRPPRTAKRRRRRWRLLVTGCSSSNWLPGYGGSWTIYDWYLGNYYS